MLALAAALPASAADLRPVRRTARRPMCRRSSTWTGFYLGLNGGDGWGSSDWAGMGVNNSPCGGMIGGTVGYNWQTPSPLGVSALRPTSTGPASTAARSASSERAARPRAPGSAPARARVGYCVGSASCRSSPAASHSATSRRPRSAFGSVSDTNVGWTVGAGIEAQVAQNWTAKVEYLYADLGSTNCSFPTCSSSSGVDLRMNILRGGLNYRFSSPTIY